jgi:hypothetical protein
LLVVRFLKRIDDRVLIWAAGLSILPFAGSLLAALPQINALQVSGATGGEIVSQSPAPLLVKIVFYLGLPVVVLGFTSLFYARSAPQDGTIFLWLLAFVPILEMCSIGVLGLANVTIHHAFVSLAGFAGIAAIPVVSLVQGQRPRLAAGIAAATFGYATLLLGLYFTMMYGDRPRWAEATELLKQHADMASGSMPAIYATEPTVIAHYLGVPPEMTMVSGLVKRLPIGPGPIQSEISWYFVDASRVSDPLKSWLDSHAERIGCFKASTGPRDRTVTVYRLKGSSNDKGST